MRIFFLLLFLPAFAIAAKMDESSIVSMMDEMKSSIHEEKFPYFINASNQGVEVDLLNSQTNLKRFVIPAGARCILVFKCPPGSFFCAVEYRGMRGIMSKRDFVSSFEQQANITLGGETECTKKGPSFFAVPGVRSDYVLNMRTRPTHKADKAGVIPHDAVCLENKDCRDGWCRVGYLGVDGWVNRRYLNDKMTSLDGAKCSVVEDLSLNEAE